jgi:hypothetical protein
MSSRESWIGVKQVRFRGTFAELAKDQFDWNPRPTDYRLSKHHERIDFDALRHSHCDQNTPEARFGFNGDLLRPLTISNGHNILPASRRSLRVKSQDAHVIRMLAERGVDKHVLPRLLDEGLWILHDPCRLTVIAHQDHALWRPFGVTDAGPTAEALRNTGLLPWFDMNVSTALVADPPTERGCLPVHAAERDGNHCKREADRHFH